MASFRRYMRAHFPTEVRREEVIVWRPPIDAGEEAQVDYGYLGVWVDPASGKRRRVWAFSMVLSYSRHLFVFPVLGMDQQAWIEPSTPDGKWRITSRTPGTPVSTDTMLISNTT